MSTQVEIHKEFGGAGREKKIAKTETGLPEEYGKLQKKKLLWFIFDRF